MVYNTKNINVFAKIVAETPNKGMRSYEFTYRGNNSSQICRKKGSDDLYSIVKFVTDFILKEIEIGPNYFWELYLSG